MVILKTIVVWKTGSKVFKLWLSWPKGLRYLTDDEQDPRLCAQPPPMPAISKPWIVKKVNNSSSVREVVVCSVLRCVYTGTLIKVFIMHQHRMSLYYTRLPTCKHEASEYRNMAKVLHI